MKKSVFINISIVSNLWLLYIGYRLFNNFSIVGLLILNWYTRKVFINREFKLDKSLRTLIFVLCGINYLFLTAIIAPFIFQISFLDWVPEFGFFIYLFTVATYINILFDNPKSNETDSSQGGK